MIRASHTVKSDIIVSLRPVSPPLATLGRPLCVEGSQTLGRATMIGMKMMGRVAERLGVPPSALLDALIRAGDDDTRINPEGSTDLAECG